MKRTLSLTTQIIVMVTLVFLVLLGSMSYMHYDAMKHYSQESETQKSELLLNSVAPVVAINLYLDMKGPMYDYLMKIIQQNPMILRLIVTDREGRKYFTYESPMAQAQTARPIFLKKSLYDKISGETIGEIEMLYSNARYEALLNEYRRFTWMLMAGAVVLLMLLLLQLRRRLAPLKKLATDLREYDPRRRNFPKKKVGGSDEIAVIHNAMVEMFEKIEQYTTRMFEMNLKLETKIRERTKILEETNEQLRREIEERTRTEEALKHANELLEQLSTKDALTGLYNRRMFEQSFENYWKMAQRERMPISILLCDIDFFKQINDRFGHLAGDKCLQELAAILKRAVKRPMDSVARYGGEEFIFVLPDTPLMGAVALANEIQKMIYDRNEKAETEIPFTLSIGVSCIVPTSHDSMQELVRQADMALYEAKRKGRNRIEVQSL
ncbi:GGDEF domain-containing protein [Hydrogenimonas sp.]